MTVEKVDNGYIVTTRTSTRVFANIDGVFAEMLLALEGRCASFGGDSYGAVVVMRERP